MNQTFQRGDIVIVLAYGNERLQRRVWEDIGTGVLICREEEYQRAIQEQDEANSSGFPKEDILELVQPIEVE